MDYTRFNLSAPHIQSWLNRNSTDPQVRGIPNFFSRSMFGRTSELKQAAAFFVVAATVGVVLRIFARHRYKTRLGWDDFCAMVAVVFLVTNQTVFSMIDYLGYTSFSFTGRRTAPEERARLAKIVIGLKLSLAFEVMYLISIFLVKFSMLFLYERFARQTRHITMYLRITQGICGITFAICVLSLFLSCVPINMFWNLYASNNQCSRRLLLTYTSGISNIITNMLVLAVPVPLLFRANLSIRQRIGVSILYFFGGFVIVASAFRFATQLLNVSVPQSIGWSQIEISLAIILACAPMSVKLLFTPLIDPDVDISRGGKNLDPGTIIKRLTREIEDPEKVQYDEKGHSNTPSQPHRNGKGVGLRIDTSMGYRESKIVREINSPDYQRLKLVRAEVNGQSVWEVQPVTPTPQV